MLPSSVTKWQQAVHLVFSRKNAIKSRLLVMRENSRLDCCGDIGRLGMKFTIVAAMLVLTGCGYPFGEPWKCDKFVDGCIIR